MKSLFEQLGGTYTLQGDYYLPDLALPTEEETQPIGIWGQRHKRYLQDHKRVTYTNLLTSGNLNAYLADINEQAENMFSRLVKEMAKMQGVTEQLKTKNQMVWVGKMNSIRNAAIEVVNKEIIFCINYICLFDYLFISSQMSAKPYFMGSTGILHLR